MKWKSDLFKYFPKTICKALENVNGEELCEIRFRVNRKIQLVYMEHDVLVDYIVSEAECKILLELLCEHSIYAKSEELKNSFVTLPKGYRVGVCGSYSLEHGKMGNLTAASYFNYRIAREHTGAADEAIKYIANGKSLYSTLVASAPGVGKTTLLRDAARIISSDRYSKKVCIADERSEIAGSVFGVPCLDVGERTDVMDGCPKAQAMMSMIRTMSPDVIITDEIGSADDINAIKTAASCGVCVVASVHASSVFELLNRPNITELIKNGIFQNVLFLSRENGKISVKKAVL